MLREGVLGEAEVRIKYETRLEAHERNCTGLRYGWHTLIGEHVRLATWDWQESSFMVERCWDRIRENDAKMAALLERWAVARSVALPDALSGQGKGDVDG